MFRKVTGLGRPANNRNRARVMLTSQITNRKLPYGSSSSSSSSSTTELSAQTAAQHDEKKNIPCAFCRSISDEYCQFFNIPVDFSPG